MLGGIWLNEAPKMLTSEIMQKHIPLSDVAADDVAIFQYMSMKKILTKVNIYRYQFPVQPTINSRRIKNGAIKCVSTNRLEQHKLNQN